MKELSPNQQTLVYEFAAELQHVQTVDDLFPPEGGVRELLPEPQPTLPDSGCVCMAALYEVMDSRQRRQLMLAQADGVVTRIGGLVMEAT